jgi:hypothetical protein
MGSHFPTTSALADDAAEPLREQRVAALRHLPDFAADYPEATFVWIDAACSGGTCLYLGYGFRAREILVRAEDPSPHGLRPLIQVFAVDIGFDQFFLPLTRGFCGR